MYRTALCVLACLSSFCAAAAAPSGRIAPSAPEVVRASFDTGVLPRFATHTRTGINCGDSPFGRHAVIGEDSEFVNLYGGSVRNNFDIYESTNGTLVQASRSGLINQGALSGTTFLKATAVDLNGDGRDEVVSVHRVNSNSQLRLGVFRRGAGGAIELAQTWNLARTFNHVDLLAGDLNGSSDGQQELGLLLRGTSPAALEVRVLTGTADGRIAQADGQAAGRWARTGVFGSAALAVGDLLLDGRDQLVLVNESGSGGTRALNYHLLEFQPTTSALPVVSGDSQIGTFTHTTSIGTAFNTDDGGGPSLDQIDRIRAVAGDVTDSAAAELYVLVQFRASSFNYIGTRLHHFTTTRNAANAITGVGFFSRGGGADWDSSQLLVNQNADAPPGFDAVIANIDRVSPSELVLVQQEMGNNRLSVQAYKARVQLSAGFLWERNGTRVTFTDQSTGQITSREWNFGDGTGPIDDPNPIHVFATPGTYNVRLRVTGPGGTIDRTNQVVVTSSGGGSGGQSAQFRYQFNATPTYQAFRNVDSAQDLAFLSAAVGDMNRDGIAEVMTVVRDRSLELLRSTWKLTNTSNPASFAGQHFPEPLSGLDGMSGMSVVAADLDGDSLKATLGTDCRQVEEPQLRQVIWLPPYWARWQSGAEKVASFGESTSGGSSTETLSGSFTSHDVSAYVGVSVGSEIAGVEASVRATAGYNYQTNYGALHGSENTLRLDQSYSQENNEALVVMEENSFNCFSYTIGTQAAGAEPNSGMRMCELIEGTRLLSATDAEYWDRAIPAAPVDQPPAQWMPLARDWASLSLFRSVTTNVTPAGGSSAANVTDGRFSSALTANAARTAPWVQIDLGEIREISNIRVFPRAGQAAKLKGFRVHISQQPMSGDAVPSGPGVVSFAPGTGDDVAYERWNIWTRDRTAQSGMRSARYIRLQHPGSAVLDVAQIQVFGDVHQEPPAYPDAVCDPQANDGRFEARVWDVGAATFRTIDVRGDMLWNGSAPSSGSGVPGCTNYSGLPNAPIWQSIAIGNSGTNAWNLSSESSNLIGNTVGFESSVRVGAEFDVEAGFIAKVQAGGAYEYTSGITEEVQTAQFWGSGLEIGGAIGGFATSDGQVIAACRYTPRPYAYRLVDVSNTGYEHTAYAVDYVIRQGQGMWQRGSVPQVCLNVQLPNEIFESGFED
jgi:PKD repeat protein